MRPIFAALFFGALAAALGASLPWAIVIGIGTVPAVLGFLLVLVVPVEALERRQRRRRYIEARAKRGFR